MPPDVARCQCTVDRISDRMHPDIRIGMTHKRLIMRHFNAAQDNMIPRPELVNVIAIAKPNFHLHIP